MNTHNQFKRLFATVAISLTFLFAFSQNHENNIPKSHNVVWDSPSKDALDAMPLSGRKGAGANVWVQDGSIWLYLAHNGAYDEEARLLKLGCVRLTPKDSKLGGTGFRQELDLASGTILISQGDFKASLWFAGETLIFESESGKPQPFDVAFGSWRNQHRDSLRLDMFRLLSINPDNITTGKEGFSWFHRNADFGVNVVNLAKQQGIPAEAVHDITTNRIFGGAIVIDKGISTPVETDIEWQFWKGKAWTGQTVKSKKQVIAIRIGSTIDGNINQWKSEAKSMLSPEALKNARADELKRWKEFWSRSNIMVNPDAKPDDSGWLIGRNYQLFRVTKPETMQLARDTWETIPADRARLCKQDYSWMANVVNMAALAWPDSAKKRAIYKLANIAAPQARFPAFFGPGHDWLPDHNWGGSGMVGLQEMLMAADPYGDGKIYLLPAWPKEWDVDFKLHAPQQTTVEASVRNGKVVLLKIFPESRQKDIVISPAFME